MAGHDLAAYTELVRLSVCERLSRPPHWQAERELAFYREQFRFLLAELAAVPGDCSVLVEGADLLPDLLHGNGVPMDRAVWMVPTPQFQLRHYALREWVPAYLRDCTDPEQAFRNWMHRDALFAGHVSDLAAAVGARVIIVDGTRTLAETAQLVERHLGLPGGDKPA
jgi:hypothetical protein